MNPIVKVKQASHFVIYKLTANDYKKLSKTSLIEGAGDHEDNIMHKMCIMQAVSMASSQDANPHGNWSDHPVCVSEQITDFLIGVNDSPITKRQRNSLKKLIPDILNTAPIKRTYFKTKTVDKPYKSDPDYKAAERERIKLLKDNEDQILEDLASKKRGTFSRAVKLVKEAAELYHAPDEGPDKEVVEI